jgi:Putative addiction module component
MSSARVHTLLGLVAALSDAERRELHTKLDGAFATSEKEWESDWNGELSRRMAQIENGEVELVDGDDVLADLRSDLTP